MVQAYSSNLSVPAGAAYPLNSATITKGCSAVVVGATSIQLNQRGIYNVHCDGFATPAAATLVSTQLFVDGVARPEAISSFTGVDETVDTFGFDTLVQVSENNTNCCCTSPTVLQFMNGVTAVTDGHINVIVTKLC